MPTYFYRCQSCGVEFDKYQKFTDRPLTRCPECRKGRVNRIPQATAVVFKGSGWYVNDSKGKSSTASKPKSDSPADSPAKAEAKAEPKAESKAEAKPEAGKAKAAADDKS